VTLGEASGDRGQAAVWSRVLAALLGGNQAAVWSRVLAALLGGNSCDLKEETWLKTRALRRPLCSKRAGSKQEEMFSAKLSLHSALC